LLAQVALVEVEVVGVEKYRVIADRVCFAQTHLVVNGVCFGQKVFVGDSRG
jgi:hypothetical protein